MQAGKVIYKLLKDSAEVGAICGDKIYPEVAQQTETMPLLVYTIESANPSGTKSGTSSLDVVQFDVLVMSTDYSQCMDLGTAARGALDRIGGMINGVPVQSIDFQSQAVDFDYPTDAHVIVQTYQMRLQFTGTVNSYGAIYTAPTFDFISVGLSADKLDGGSTEFTFSTSTPLKVSFDDTQYKAGANMELNTSTGVITTSQSGYYRVSACVTFMSSHTNQQPTMYVMQDTTALNTLGTALINRSDIQHSLHITEFTEVTGSADFALMVYCLQNTSSTMTISAVTFSVERVVQ